MGAWNTLHLFDSENFYKKGVPHLKVAQNDLMNDYLDFLKSFRIGGISNLTSSELEKILNRSMKSVREIADQFDAEFKKHKEYNRLHSFDEKREYLNEHDQYYEFGRFFEMYIFRHYSDFYPHISCGKYGLYSKLDVDSKSVAAEIIANLEDSDNYFCADGAGIVNWISKEDTQILFQCKEDFHPEEEYRPIFNSFFRLVEIACDNGLGLIRGVDMREGVLHELTHYKLITKDKWIRYDFDGIFEV